MEPAFVAGSTLSVRSNTLSARSPLDLGEQRILSCAPSNTQIRAIGIGELRGLEFLSDAALIVSTRPADSRTSARRPGTATMLRRDA